MTHCSCGNFQYLRTPMGAVKVVNIIFGAVSLILVAISYVPVWTHTVFLSTVVICLILSLLYISFFILASPRVTHTKANRVTNFIYHVLAGTALIAAGIELIGWSEYDNHCNHDCPKLYSVGVAKTLTFMNGVLYMIVGFLGVKDDDMLDSESSTEDVPLLMSTSLTSIPGSGIHHNPNPNNFYDNHNHRHSKISFEDVRSNFYRYQNRPHAQTVDHSFNNSYSSNTSNENFIHHVSTKGKRTKHMQMAYSVPSTGFANMKLIRE